MNLYDFVVAMLILNVSGIYIISVWLLRQEIEPWIAQQINIQRAKNNRPQREAQRAMDNAIINEMVDRGAR